MCPTCAQISLKLDYNLKLKFLLSTFSQNGTWLGFHNLEDQFWYARTLALKMGVVLV